MVTRHFAAELFDEERKTMDLVLEVLEAGKPRRESRGRTKVTKKTKGGSWEIVYAETRDQVVLIHFKKVRRK